LGSVKLPSSATAISGAGAPATTEGSWYPTETPEYGPWCRQLGEERRLRAVHRAVEEQPHGDRHDREHEALAVQQGEEDEPQMPTPRHRTGRPPAADPVGERTPQRDGHQVDGGGDEHRVERERGLQAEHLRQVGQLNAVMT
jgi:hypothetical protein